MVGLKIGIHTYACPAQGPLVSLVSLLSDYLGLTDPFCPPTDPQPVGPLKTYLSFKQQVLSGLITTRASFGIYLGGDEGIYQIRKSLNDPNDSQTTLSESTDLNFLSFDPANPSRHFTKGEDIVLDYTYTPNDAWTCLQLEVCIQETTKRTNVDNLNMYDNIEISTPRSFGM